MDLPSSWSQDGLVSHIAGSWTWESQGFTVPLLLLLLRPLRLFTICFSFKFTSINMFLFRIEYILTQKIVMESNKNIDCIGLIETNMLTSNAYSASPVYTLFSSFSQACSSLIHLNLFLSLSLLFALNIP